MEDLPYILVVDDDAELSAMLGEFLTAEGFSVDIVNNGSDGVTRALSGQYDAVVLDVMLPRVNGIDALRQIRQASGIPILMLTAKGDQIDRVLGLELGADDYIAKPYYPRELAARLRAVLRRGTPAAQAVPRQVRVGHLDVQISARRALWRDMPITLTATEFEMLAVLVRAGADVAGKDALSRQVLGRPWQRYDRSVDVHVSNLRLKLDAATGGAAGVETIRGVGYRLRLAR